MLQLQRQDPEFSGQPGVTNIIVDLYLSDNTISKVFYLQLTNSPFFLECGQCISLFRYIVSLSLSLFLPSTSLSRSNLRQVYGTFKLLQPKRLHALLQLVAPTILLVWCVELIMLLNVPSTHHSGI